MIGVSYDIDDFVEVDVTQHAEVVETVDVDMTVIRPWRVPADRDHGGIVLKDVGAEKSTSTK